MSAPGTPIRALVVDDSAAMRAMLASLLTADGEIEVVGSAPDPFAAREMIKTLDPDVLTLDVEMPGMDGLSFLEKIMRLRPMPVVMCSTLTARGAEVTIEALRLGAVDCIAKPSTQAQDLVAYGNSIRRTVKAAARASRSVRATPAPAAAMSGTPGAAGAFRDDALIAIGSSTGGVEALFALLPSLPADAPPVLIVQHMPAGFTAGFAARLDRACPARVVEAQDAMPVVPGTIYIAPGATQHMLLGSGPRGTVRLRSGPPVSGHSPSVDALLHSVAQFAPGAVGAILTGMGEDGAAGLLALRQAGAATFGQSEASCVVYGMPRAAMALGAVGRELPLSGLAAPILAACRTPSTSQKA